MVPLVPTLITEAPTISITRSTSAPMNDSSYGTAETTTSSSVSRRPRASVRSIWLRIHSSRVSTIGCDPPDGSTPSPYRALCASRPSAAARGSRVSSSRNRS
jgi:hypothetical protein